MCGPAGQAIGDGGIGAAASVVLRDSTKKPRPASRCFRADEVGRGCEKLTANCNREPGFFVIAVEKVFSFREDWHLDDRAKPVVRHYQTALDSILKSDSDVERCVTHYVHCRIRFLTHPRNAGRRDLRCPFGCRDHHRRQRSSQRSTAYYQTVPGRCKRKRLNVTRRCRSGGATDDREPLTQVEAPAVDIAAETSCIDDELPLDIELKVEVRLAGVVLDETALENTSVLAYVRMIVNQIEDTNHSQKELTDLLRQSMRQRSIVKRTRTDYVLRFLHEHPP